MLVEVSFQHSVQKQCAFLIRLALAVYKLQIKETDGLLPKKKNCTTTSQAVKRGTDVTWVQPSSYGTEYLQTINW